MIIYIFYIYTYIGEGWENLGNILGRVAKKTKPSLRGGLQKTCARPWKNPPPTPTIKNGSPQ